MKSLVDLQKDIFSIVHVYYTNEIDSKIHSLLKRAWIPQLPIKRQITKHPKSRMNETEQFKTCK